MSQENVALVQAFIDASGRRDLDALVATLDPAVEWTPVEAGSGYAVHRGRDDVRAWLDESSETLPNMRWEAERVRETGDETVVALVRMAGRGAASDVDVQNPAHGVLFTIRAGKIVRIAEYADPNRAFAAAGL
jgi:ketosteroid isomerase-like protein